MEISDCRFLDFRGLEEFWPQESAGIGALPNGDFRLPILGLPRVGRILATRERRDRSIAEWRLPIADFWTSEDWKNFSHKREGISDSRMGEEMNNEYRMSNNEYRITKIEGIGISDDRVPRVGKSPLGRGAAGGVGSLDDGTLPSSKAWKRAGSVFHNHFVRGIERNFGEGILTTYPH